MQNQDGDPRNNNDNDYGDEGADDGGMNNQNINDEGDGDNQNPGGEGG